MTGTPDPRHDQPGADLDDAGLDDAIATLARRSHERNRVRAHRVAELLAAANGSLDAAAREEAVRLCHTMAGSAATFGELRLSEAAGRLEAALDAGREADVRDALDALRAATA